MSANASPANATAISTLHTRLNAILQDMKQTTPPYLSHFPSFPPSQADLKLMAPRPLLSSITNAWASEFSTVGWLTNNPSNTRTVTWDGVKVTWNKRDVERISGGLKAAEDDLLRLDELPVVVSEDVKKLKEVVVFCVGLLTLRARKQLEIMGAGKREDEGVDGKFAGAIGEVVEDAFVAIGEVLGRPRVL